MSADLKRMLRALFSRRLGAMLFLGLAGGLAFDLVSFSGTLQLRLADTEKIPVEIIGLFALTSLPYVAKPLWAPLFDRYYAPGPFARFGRRRGWMLLILLVMCACCLAMGFANLALDALPLAVFALVFGFCSATFDIINDGYRTELLQPDERGTGVALSSGGYRIGMLVAGGLTPVFAALVGWQDAYKWMAAVLALGLVATWWSPSEPALTTPRPTLAEAFVKPLVQLFTRRHALLLLGIILLYRVGDAFGSSLYNVFLTRSLHFDSAEIGPIRKAVGVPATLIGMMVGGLLMVRLRLFTALVVFGVLQAGTNILLVVQSDAVGDYGMLVGVLIFENFAGGLANLAFVLLITLMCDVRFAGTQFALMAALAQLGRVLVGVVSGQVAASFHWYGYFWISVWFALPGMLLVLLSRRSLLALDRPRSSVEEAIR